MTRVRREIFKLPGREDGPWYATAWDPSGGRQRLGAWVRRSTKTTNEATAVKKARKWRTDGELAQAGLGADASQAADRSLARHVDDHIESMRNSPKDITPKHIAATRGNLVAVMEERGWTRLADVTVDGLLASIDALSRDDLVERTKRREAAEAAARVRIESWKARCERARAKGRREPKPPKEHQAGRADRKAAGAYTLSGGYSNRTKNAYITAWVRFMNWCATPPRRIGSNPLAKMAKWTEKGNERLRRRALTWDEFAALIRSTRMQPSRGGLSGQERSVLYLVAGVTGLRWGSLGSLTPRSFRLDAKRPFVAVAARDNKGRRELDVPLPGEVVEQLRGWLAGMAPDRACWPLGESGDGADLVQRDMIAAGVPLRDEHGRVADFHALRHTTGTWMARDGVSLQSAAKILGHASSTTTERFYSHLDTEHLGTEIDKVVSRSRCASLRAGMTAQNAPTGSDMVIPTDDRVPSGIAADPEPPDHEDETLRPDDPTRSDESTPRDGLEPSTCRLEGGIPADSESAENMLCARSGEGGAAPICAQPSDGAPGTAAPRKRQGGGRVSARDKADAGMVPDARAITARLAHELGELAALCTGGAGGGA